MTTYRSKHPLSKLFNQEKFSDLKIFLPEDTFVYAHQLVVTSGSEYFQGHFNLHPRTTTVDLSSMPHTPEDIKVVLQYLYTGELIFPLTHPSISIWKYFSQFCEWLIIADFLGVEGVLPLIQQRIEDSRDYLFFYNGHPACIRFLTHYYTENQRFRYLDTELYEELPRNELSEVEPEVIHFLFEHAHREGYSISQNLLRLYSEWTEVTGVKIEFAPTWKYSLVSRMEKMISRKAVGQQVKDYGRHYGLARFHPELPLTALGTKNYLHGIKQHDLQVRDFDKDSSITLSFKVISAIFAAPAKYFHDPEVIERVERAEAVREKPAFNYVLVRDLAAAVNGLVN